MLLFVFSTFFFFFHIRGYLAPEMLKRQAYSASVDVWALGVIAFILLCGCLPFDDDSTKINDETARVKFQLRFPHWAQNISPEAKDFLSQLLNHDAKNRITSHEALEHKWLAEVQLTPKDKQKLLASPKHIGAVRRADPDNLPAAVNNNVFGAKTDANGRPVEGNNDNRKTTESGIGGKIKRNTSF
jgi:serine/threonine protein kinase